MLLKIIFFIFICCIASKEKLCEEILKRANSMTSEEKGKFNDLLKSV